MSVKGPASESKVVDVPVAPAVRGAVVSRRALFERLAGAERVVQISAPAGSGKTVLARSWIAGAGLGDRVAWVTVDRDERDPGRFWARVADALRGTAPGAALVRPLTAAMTGLTGVVRQACSKNARPSAIDSSSRQITVVAGSSRR